MRFRLIINEILMKRNHGLLDLEKALGLFRVHVWVQRSAHLVIL